MQIGRFRLGMRTIKSALAVFICMLVFHFFQRGNPLIAALSAVFSLRQDLTSTVSFGRSRIIGNSIGGVLAIIFFFIKHYFHNDFLVELFLLPVLVIITIVVSDGIDNNSGIISAISTLLMISLSIPQGESTLYALQRVFDTFIGTFIALGINFVLRPPEDEKKKELAEDLVELQKKERTLRKSLVEIEKQIEKQKK